MLFFSDSLAQAPSEDNCNQYIDALTDDSVTKTKEYCGYEDLIWDYSIVTSSIVKDMTSLAATVTRNKSMECCT